MSFLKIKTTHVKGTAYHVARSKGQWYVVSRVGPTFMILSDSCKNKVDASSRAKGISKANVSAKNEILNTNF